MTVPELSARRRNAMRAGYLFMGAGLATVKWPLLTEAYTLPLYEGVVVCMLTAMSLLAFVGLRYPEQLLPLLLLESAWKILWLGVVALPRAIAGDIDAATADVVVSCALVVVILAVVPWRYVWHRYVLDRSEPVRAGWTS